MKTVLELDFIVLDFYIPAYLDFQDKVNFFMALNWEIADKHFIGSAKKTKNYVKTINSKINPLCPSLLKEISYELQFIRLHWPKLSLNLIDNLNFIHWFYISAYLPIDKKFLIEYKNRLIVPALVNNKQILSIKLWNLSSCKDVYFKIFNCWICAKTFVTYRRKTLVNSYFRHPCYFLYFYHNYEQGVDSFYKLYFKTTKKRTTYVNKYRDKFYHEYCERNK